MLIKYKKSDKKTQRGAINGNRKGGKMSNFVPTGAHGNNILKVQSNTFKHNRAPYQNKKNISVFPHTNPLYETTGISITNVPFHFKEEDIRRVFSSCGEIAIIEKGKEKGVWEVNFESPSSAQSALKMKQSILRVLNDNKIFIKNVPLEVDEEGLKQLFSTCGKIKYARIHYEKGSDGILHNKGPRNGSAALCFQCSTSVPLALKMNGKVLGKIRVSPFTSKEDRNKRGYNTEKYETNDNMTHKEKGTSQPLVGKIKENETFKEMSAETKKRKLEEFVQTLTKVIELVKSK